MKDNGTSYRAGRDDWMDLATCWWLFADDFHISEQGGSGDRAKDACKLCPVRAECLAYAMRIETAAFREGIYGGFTPLERRELARRGWKAGDPLPPIRTRSDAHRPERGAA